MKLSTTVGIAMLQPDIRQLQPIPRVMRMLKEIGFEALDINFCLQDFPGYILSGDGWEDRVAEIGEVAEALELEVFQSHLPFVSGFAMSLNPRFRETGYEDYFRECIRRACIASGQLRVRWAVAHPLSFPELNYERRASLEANRRFYDPYVELCIRKGTGFAFENALPDLNRNQPTRYCQHYEELMELVDSYADPMVGICWDTGHANQMKLNQRRAIEVMGGRIKCLHLNDNHYGTRDEHLLPFMGDVDWDGVVQALVDTGYAGTLNYETVAYAKSARGAFQRKLVEGCYENAVLLRQMFENAGE